MSNAKLKEQIEAAKIALVHSAEASAHAETTTISSTVTQIPRNGTDHAQPNGDDADNRDGTSHIDNKKYFAEVPHPPASAEAQMSGHDTMAQSDFEKLEARLQGLEDQIKNQQRDLHTLLQKLRDITAKSHAATERKNIKGKKKSLVGVTLCIVGFGAVYYWLGPEVITGTLYQIIGFIMALIDTLAGKI